jgi:hypothetical protein
MMKKALLLLSILLLSLTINGQIKQIKIPWGGVSKTINNNSFKNFDATKDHETTFSLLTYLDPDMPLLYRKQWEDNGYANERSLKVSNVKYGNLTVEELNKVRDLKIPQNLDYKIFSSKARNTIYTTVSISPVVKTNLGYQKVISFSIDYKKDGSLSKGRRLPITNSVLASGDWYKFKVENTGIHRIDKNFLNDLGMNTDGIDPRNIMIYGNGGKPLPLLNAENNEFDLAENAIQVIGEEDGIFNNGDFILFYGISTLGYDEENDTNINPYSDESYYFITIGDIPGNRVQSMTEPSGTANFSISQFNDYAFYEEDEYSPAKVGRRWFGNRFDIESEQQFEFNFPNIVSSQPMLVKVKGAASSESNTSMAIAINGTSVDPLSFNPINDPVLLNTDEFEGEIPAGGENIIIDLIYNNSGNPASIAYLDYISIEALRQLTGTGSQLQFRFNDVSNLNGIGEYQIGNASQFTQVWDVTNIRSITSKQNTGGASNFSFKATMGELREYVAVNQNDYFTPVVGAQTTVPNQNLKGTIFNDASGIFRDIDYLIVTPPFLIQPALRLANHRKLLDGLNVKVVTTDKIYNEFSSGKQDIGAIRNFIRYIYENASSDSNKIKYVCLFGDSSIDYKDRLSNNNNIIPTFHTLFSNSTFASFMSDDYFGNMDINEGTIGLLNDGIPNNGADIDKLDIAVGRILADDVALANRLVDKIIQYESIESYGNWRNNFVLISDDVDELFEYNALQVSLDELGDEVSQEKPFVNVKKIHCDSYQQETSAGGNRYPDVNEAFLNAIEVGGLVINYFGHGGEEGLAKEFIFTKGAAENLRNKNRYTCFITVTCEFTKFDNPLRETAGEVTYWNPEGGAISLVTTTRSIGVSVGGDFNDYLAPEIFGYGLDIPNTPAEAVRSAKNSISSTNRRVVFYIGDPSMRLAFPKQKIRLTTLNGVPLEQATDTLKALSKVRLGGEVVDENGTLLTNYNGILEAKVFDKNVERQTLGNDGVTNNGELLIMNFITLGEGLFNGQASINNGQFEFDFVVPRDIQIPVGNGRVSLYAKEDNALVNQTGFNLDLMVGGLNEEAPEDNIGPTIQLFMNDESFVSGGITNDSPILIAKLQDENGINTASGIGHDIIAILDDDESNPFVMNEYYQADVDDFSQGVASFKLRDLEEGLHTLTLRAWDVYNNSSTANIQFIVAGDGNLEITRVLNYPNPFVDYTEFWFNHNRPFEPLDVQVQVFTVTGKVVWTKNQIITNDGFLSRDIVWDGKDDFGDRIGKGVYVYKITVKSTLTNHRVEKFEKLVIL